MRLETNQKYIQLNDGMKIPTVGFGTWKITDAEAPAVVDQALASSYRLIDTASVYANEEGVGIGINQSSVKREEIFLTTKVWNSDHGYDATLRAMEASLKRLNTSYVDLYLIHWPRVNSEKYIPTWKALERLRREGITKSIGVSNFNASQIEKLINETGIVPAINQVELHPYFQQKDLRSFHDKHKIITESWSPLGRANFTDDKLITSLCEKYKKSWAQIVLRWHYENGLVAIPKSVNPTRILENLNIFDFNIAGVDLQKLNELDRPDGRTGPDPLTADF